MTRHPRGHLKLTGDTHLPDVESDDLEIEEGTAPLAKLARDANSPRRVAVRHAGMLRDPDFGSDNTSRRESAFAHPSLAKALARPRTQVRWMPLIFGGLALMALRRLRR
ncbi:hypothetical protein [Ramlibacter humi]|uniref:Uncharacterized protein n=1 Tax=Ramlibacter humi TaxID=2530451 RepID=A0A4Z0BID3_9BURK|nr:hypothetical protein [Ramlibacter humi]TFY98169.1 hypothetical protein EZ216_16325 [Ramlibacter humi]